MSELIASIGWELLVGAAASVAAAIIFEYLLRRQGALSQRSERTAESIATLVQSREAEKRAELLNSLIDKLPKGAKPEEVLAPLELLAAKLSALPVSKPARARAGENLIEAYHEQALSQARVQFWFSVTAATVGFGWILYAGSEIDPTKLATVAKTLPGIVMDVVAFLFFKQAAETRSRATEFYDRLRKDRQLTDSAGSPSPSVDRVGCVGGPV